MTSARPPIGLLLDVDGPVSNPDAKRIVEPTIVPSLVALLNRGIPIVLNTGRSAEFVRRQVFGPVLAASPERIDRFHAVCEKGAVWLSAASDGDLVEEIDRSIAVPSDMEAAVERLVNERYADTTFFDDTKHAMISTERNLDTSHDDYAAAQARFIDDAFELITSMGYGVRHGNRIHADAKGETPYRLDPTIIATDVESVVVGKDLGARRALELLEGDGALPESWRTVGDSDSDYAMAGWLHERGERVAHVDVRPREGLLAALAYPVHRPVNLRFDDAGAAYLRWVLEWLRGSDDLEKHFDVRHNT